MTRHLLAKSTASASKRGTDDQKIRQQNTSRIKSGGKKTKFKSTSNGGRSFFRG